MASLAESNPNTSSLTEEGIIRVPGLLSRYVRLANGAKAHYVTSGEDGPPVILLHGGIEGIVRFGWVGGSWPPCLGSNGFRVYCPDRPGYGLADVSKPEYLVQEPQGQRRFPERCSPTPSCIDKFHVSRQLRGRRRSAPIMRCTIRNAC